MVLLQKAFAEEKVEVKKKNKNLLKELAGLAS